MQQIPAKSSGNKSICDARTADRRLAEIKRKALLAKGATWPCNLPAKDWPVCFHRVNCEAKYCLCPERR